MTGEKSLQSLLKVTTEYLSKHHIPTPRLDAEVLLASMLGMSRVDLYLHFDRPMEKSELDGFREKIQRRLRGEPVSYIRGVKEFWSLPFKVGPGVMIPRPDTEVLVETVARRLSPVARHQPLAAGHDAVIRVLDIGTGSGNIAIALAKELPSTLITATDTSERALDYARENAGRNYVESQIEFIHQDFSSLVLCPSSFVFDLIVSNPPYISTKVIETLDRDIKDYEPREAFDGGPDGLDFYRRMGECCPRLLKPEGLLAVEIGEDQSLAVKQIFERCGLGPCEVIKDYAGLDRVVLVSNRRLATINKS